ncbi:MAG: oligosaccharide flippase family protein [Bacteroidaceae bacterium]|nr:oligosaccharide flippase family protein [Bacteroidaceae bacterium]
MKLLSSIKRYNRIIANFFSLSLINGISYIIALFLVPYLLRILGEEKYGAYLFVYVIAQYLLLFGNYGFKFSTTRLISVNRDNIEKVNAIFNATIWTRFILTLVASSIGFLLVVLFMESSDVLMYLFALGMVFGDILIPSWLFQGMEQMKYMTIATVVSKLVFAALIFVFIKSPDQYVYVLLLHSLGYIASGVTSIYIAVRQFGVKLGLTTFAEIKEQLKEGWQIFISNIGIEVYRNSNVFLLGIFVGDAAAGIFGAVEKIMKAVQTLFNALPMAVYPYISRMFYNGVAADNVTVLKRLLKWASLVLLPLMLILAVCNPLVAAYLDLPVEIVKWVLLLMLPALFFGCLNYIAGIVGLVNLGASGTFQRNIWVAGISSVALMLATCQQYSYYAASLAWTWAETLLFVLCLLSLKRYKDFKIKP